MSRPKLQLVYECRRVIQSGYQDMVSIVGECAELGLDHDFLHGFFLKLAMKLDCFVLEVNFVIRKVNILDA